MQGGSGRPGRLSSIVAAPSEYLSVLVNKSHLPVLLHGCHRAGGEKGRLLAMLTEQPF